MKAVVEDEPPRNAEEHLALRLKALRREKGLTQSDLAERMTELGHGWHQTTVAKTENADRPVRLNEVEALAKAVGVPLNDLLSERPAVPLEGPVAIAAEHLERAERIHSRQTERYLEAARDHGTALGAVQSTAKFLEEQEKRVEEAAAEFEAARKAYEEAVGRG